MKQDRFLTGILIIIGLLIVVAVGLFFLRGNDQAYGAEDSPEGVIRNYALALQNMDYERAYTYLANNSNKPDLETFRRSFLDSRLETSNSSIQIRGSINPGSSEVLIDIAIIQTYNDIFSSPYYRDEIASLTKEPEGWKIQSMPYPYWGWDWYQPSANPTKLP